MSTPERLYHFTSVSGWGGIQRAGCILPSDPGLTFDGGVGAPVVWLTSSGEPLWPGPAVRLRVNANATPWAEWAYSQPGADARHLDWLGAITIRSSTYWVHPGPVPLDRITEVRPLPGRLDGAEA